MFSIKSIIKFLAMSVAMIAVLPAQGQTLREYLKEAAENSPRLKASFNEFLAAQEKAPQAGALPDPELSFGYFLEPMELPMGARRADISIMQMFPWFGTLRAAKDEASQMANAKYQAFVEQKNQLFYEVKNAWYELYRLEEEIRLMEENLEILRSYERMALAKFRSGGGESQAPGGAMNAGGGTSGMQRQSGGSMEDMAASDRVSSASPPMQSMQTSGGSMADVLRAQMDIKDMENTLESLRASRAPLIARFNAALNRPVGAPVAIADTLAPAVHAPAQTILPDTAIEANPMVRMYEAERAAYEARQSMARKEGLPMFGLGVNYMIMGPVTNPENQAGMGGKNMAMPMATLTLPIYGKKYNAMAKEAELRMEIAESRQAEARNSLAVQWSEAMQSLQDAQRELQLYAEQERLAGQTVRLLVTSYSADRVDFEETLRARRQLIDYRLRLINAVVNQHKAIAKLDWLLAAEL